MTAYLIRRGAASLVVIVGIALLTFVMLHVFGLGHIALAGIIVVTLLLLYEHSIVSPKDLRRMNAAFFTLNGVISVLLFGFVTADVILRHKT